MPCTWITHAASAAFAAEEPGRRRVAVAKRHGDVFPVRIDLGRAAHDMTGPLRLERARCGIGAVASSTRRMTRCSSERTTGPTSAWCSNRSPNQSP